MTDNVLHLTEINVMLDHFRRTDIPHIWSWEVAVRAFAPTFISLSRRLLFVPYAPSIPSPHPLPPGPRLTSIVLRMSNLISNESIPYCHARQTGGSRAAGRPSGV